MKNELIMNKKRLTNHEAHLRDETTNFEWENEYLEQIEAKQRKEAHQPIDNNSILNKNKKLKQLFTS